LKSNFTNSNAASSDSLQKQQKAQFEFAHHLATHPLVFLLSISVTEFPNGNVLCLLNFQLNFVFNSEFLNSSPRHECQITFIQNNGEKEIILFNII
jgi:hypothetical protein